MIYQTVFKEYDIRGHAFTEITHELSYAIGFCFATMHISRKDKNICVGYDARASSKIFFQSLSQGIIDAGAKVINIGLSPTPLLYFADYILKPTASIMITASHNPESDNGFKLISKGSSFFGQSLQKLYKNIISSPLKTKSYTPYKYQYLPTNLLTIDMSASYINKVTQNLQCNTNLKIAWDIGESAARNIINKLTTILPCHHVIIAKQTEDISLNGLMQAVKTNKCDLGIAFDKDADRVYVISDKAELIIGDILLCFFAQDILRCNPCATVVADIKTSNVVLNQIKNYGGQPVISKTGHVFIKDKIKQTNAIFGGEVSGHFYFADNYYGYDDGIYTALRLIDLISRIGIKFSKALESLPKIYATKEIRIKIPLNQKFLLIQKIKNYLNESNINFDDTDGILVTSHDDKWLIRASNTENMLVIRCESTNKMGLNKVKLYVQNLLNIILKPIKIYL